MRPKVGRESDKLTVMARTESDAISSNLRFLLIRKSYDLNHLIFLNEIMH